MKSVPKKKKNNELVGQLKSDGFNSLTVIILTNFEKLDVIY